MTEEKRLLTPQEIDFILGDCQHRGLTTEQNKAVTESALFPIRNSLATVEVYPAIIPKLKEQITRKYYKSRVEAGNCVGATMGQVLGEDQTQAELNKFHQAGAGVVLLNGISGVQRFNELLICSSKPKGQLTSIYFKNPPETIEKARELVGTDIQQITLENLTKNTPEYYYSQDGFDEEWYDLFEEFFEEYLPENFTFEQTRYRIVVSLDAHQLKKWGLTEISVADALSCMEDVVVVFSPTAQLQIHLFVESCDFGEASWIGELHQFYLSKIANKLVTGITGVEALHFRRENEGEARWMALAEGERLTHGNTVKLSVSRYIRVLALDYVDQFLTISNNVWDVVMVYGIESVRELMIYEFLSCSDDVYSKNACHVELLVDIMLYTGRISAVSKTGVNPDTAQILLRASFEQVIPQFTTAAVHTECDEVSSSSAGMICGSICSVGTAVSSLMMAE